MDVICQVKRVPVDGEDATGGYSVGSLEKPTARLSQYARGKTGNMNPFTPGGEVSVSFQDSFGSFGIGHTTVGDIQTISSTLPTADGSLEVHTRDETPTVVLRVGLSCVRVCFVTPALAPLPSLKKITILLILLIIFKIDIL